MAASGSGTYSVDAGGFVSIDNPLRTGAKINARYGAEAVLGSSTEAADNNYDLFVAIPTPSGGAVFGGPYTTVSLEFPGGTTANMRSVAIQPQHRRTRIDPEFFCHRTRREPRRCRRRPSSITGRELIRWAPTAWEDCHAWIIRHHATRERQPHAVPFGERQHRARRIYRGRRSRYSDRRQGGRLAQRTPPGTRHFGARVCAWIPPRCRRTPAVPPHAGQGKLTLDQTPQGCSASAQLDFTAINGYALAADGTGTSELTVVGLGAAGKGFVGAAINNSGPRRVRNRISACRCRR